MKTLCDICQKVTETKVIGGMTICRQEVAESEWEQGKLYTDPAFVSPRNSTFQRVVCPLCRRHIRLSIIGTNTKDERTMEFHASQLGEHNQCAGSYLSFPDAKALRIEAQGDEKERYGLRRDFI